MSRLVLAAALAAAVLACSTPVAHAAAGFPVTVTAANGKVVVKQRPTPGGRSRAGTSPCRGPLGRRAGYASGGGWGG